MQSARILLFILSLSTQKVKSGAFLSIGLITNFLSEKEMFLISLHGNPILGVSWSFFS